MNQQTLFARPSQALLILVAALGCTGALAAGKSAAPSGKAQYQRDIAFCSSGKYVGERADCLSEASTRFAATQPVAPDDDPGRYSRNALKRCEALREPDRQDCVLRMQGQGTTSGSVAGGGIYRELVTREIGPPALAAPEVAPAAPAAAK